MDGLIFLAILVAAAKYAVKEGKKNAEKKKAAQQTHWQQADQAERPQQATQPRHYHPAFDSEEVQPVTMQDLMRQAKSAASTVKEKMTQHRPSGGSMAYDSSEGEGHIDGDYRFEEITPRSDDHVVKPFTESKHVHTESTIMGAEVCEPEEKDVYEMPSSVVSEAEMSDIRKAIIWSEIIGKPRALRR